MMTQHDAHLTIIPAAHLGVLLASAATNPSELMLMSGAKQHLLQSINQSINQNFKSDPSKILQGPL